jgi:hypothetical protein
MPNKTTTSHASPNSDHVNRLEPVPERELLQPTIGEQAESDPDPFDPAKLVLDQSYLKEAAAQKVWLEIDVRRPGVNEFFRVRPEAAFRLGPIAFISNQAERGAIYALDPALARSVKKLKHTIAVLYTCMNVDGDPFLWPVTVPGSNGGSILAWHTSAVEGAQRAMMHWITLDSNQRTKRYDARDAEGEIPEPDWPPLTLSEMLKIALKDRFIKDYDHPVLRRARGIFD